MATEQTLLGGAFGHARVERARWILALDELHRDIPHRPWITLSEWMRTWPRSRDEPLSKDGVKSQWIRLQRALRAIGLDLQVETPQVCNHSLDGFRMHVGTPALRELVQFEFRDARDVLERHVARAENRAPEIFDDDPNPAEVVENYCAKSATLRPLSRRYGRSRRCLAKIIRASGRDLRPRGRRRIEQVRPAELVDRALLRWDEGASVRAIARLLKCTRSSARDFLRRNGRYPRS